MTILINENSKVLVQGITGKSGSLQSKIMLNAGTNIVAGVTPGKGGQKINGITVYNNFKEVKNDLDFDTVISFVPPRFVLDSTYEAIDFGAKVLVVTTEGIARHEVIKMLEYAKRKNCFLIGPGCAGIIAPGVCKVGTHPDKFFKKGNVGVVSKSGALSYEVCKTLTDNNIGQSTVVSIGGGPFWGFTQRDAISEFEKDNDTDLIVLLGEIGGNQEEKAADYIKKYVKKPVISMIVGRHAPKSKSLGHAGAIVSKNSGTAETKIEALKNAGVKTVNNLDELIDEVKKILK